MSREIPQEKEFLKPDTHWDAFKLIMKQDFSDIYKFMQQNEFAAKFIFFYSMNNFASISSTLIHDGIDDDVITKFLNGLANNVNQELGKMRLPPDPNKN